MTPMHVTAPRMYMLPHTTMLALATARSKQLQAMELSKEGAVGGAGRAAATNCTCVLDLLSDRH